MTFETPRVAKEHAWNAGAEAFADFVQKALAEVVKACEENEAADVPVDWITVAQRFTRVGQYMLTDGLVTVRDHNPFVLREFTDADTRRLLRVVGVPPKNMSAVAPVRTAQETPPQRRRQRPAASGLNKGASDDPTT